MVPEISQSTLSTYSQNINWQKCEGKGLNGFRYETIETSLIETYVCILLPPNISAVGSVRDFESKTFACLTKYLNKITSLTQCGSHFSGPCTYNIQECVRLHTEHCYYTISGVTLQDNHIYEFLFLKAFETSKLSLNGNQNMGGLTYSKKETVNYKVCDFEPEIFVCNSDL